MKFCLYLLLIFVATLIFFMSTFTFSIKERFQEYIYIPPQSVISHHDDSYRMMMSSLYGMNSQLPQLPQFPLPNFNNFGSNYATQPRQYTQFRTSPPTQYPATTPAATPAITPAATPATTPAATPNTKSTILPKTPSAHGGHGTVDVGVNDKNEANHLDPNAFPLHDGKASLHQEFTDGEMINPTKLDPIFTKLGLPSYEDIITKLDSINAFLPGQPSQKKLAVAYTTLTLVGKLKTLPASKFVTNCPKWNEENSDHSRCAEAGKVYGLMKYNSIIRNFSKVKSLMDEHGGNQYPLTDDEMMTLWSTNEHHNLHCCLDPGGTVGNALHMTSLNNRAHVFESICLEQPLKCSHPEILNPVKDVVCSWPETRPDRAAGDGSLCKNGWSGGYNDTGRNPQWNWFRSVMMLGDLLGISA